jgi:leucine-rich repeat-containing protein 49
MLKPEPNLVLKLIQEEKDERYRYLLRHGNLHNIEAETYTIYVELPQIPNVVIVYRRPQEREQNPDKILLDQRGLRHIPLLEGEDKVKYLNLQNNFITKIENIISVPNLNFLDLSLNQLTEISMIPEKSTLKVLILSKNKISSIKNLQMFPSLDLLDLHDNHLSLPISINESFGCLENLRILNLSNNSIEEIKFDCSLPNLKELNLRNNKIKKIMISPENVEYI